MRKERSGKKKMIRESTDVEMTATTAAAAAAVAAAFIRKSNLSAGEKSFSKTFGIELLVAVGIRRVACLLLLHI